MNTGIAFTSNTLALHRLRVNVKSLAAEARIIRHETARAGAAYRHFLSEHRRGKLREESRYAQLALAFVRGRKYRNCEVKTAVAPELGRLLRKLERFDLRPAADDVSAWLSA
jgi:hypothetical protein